jgi:signal-transduction protein with cAMP-binding, CBS, and nucleotidyltransferase domain
MRRSAVSGIVTEKDLIRRVVALHKDPAETQVVEMMSFPLVAVPPSYSVLSAGKKMDTMHLHRLVVMKDNAVAGIVTQTDIARAVRGELERLQREHETVTREMGDLIQYVMEDLEKLQAFVCGGPRLTAKHEWAARMTQSTK